MKYIAIIVGTFLLTLSLSGGSKPSQKTYTEAEVDTIVLLILDMARKQCLKQKGMI